MRKQWWNSLVWCCISAMTVCSLSAYEQDLLKSTDVHRIMQQILSEHLGKKEISQQVLQNALKIYITQFDPSRMYLLESEIAPFVNLSPAKLQQAIEDYQRDGFALFQSLNQVIQKSIERSRRIREGIELEVKNQTFHVSPDSPHSTLSHLQEFTTFPKTEQELKTRLIENIGIFLDLQKKRSGGNLTPKQKEKLIQAYEARLRDFENQYLYQNEKGQPLTKAEQENLFTLHVLKALANSLDAHTSFYEAHEAYDLRVRLQKEFKGIGLVLKETTHGVSVSHLIDGGPAAKSKLIQIGDVLLEINGKSIQDDSFERIMEILHQENASVKLVFKRQEKDGADKIYTVELQRETIILNNDRVDVYSEPFGSGIIGVITLHSFYQGNGVSSEKDVRDAIAQLEKKGHLRGLILDLRDNSGGFLSQAVKVAGLFISNGVIVISKYSNGEEKFYRDIDGKTVYDGPLIVLTSKMTASAAEIVAQALQDYGVALIVGDEHTYGKGTIQTQTVTDNQSSSYFKVTVGKYYTVSGHTPQKQGVKADIVVPGHWSRERVGESYMDSVDPDVISPAYEDHLTDISPEVRSWYLKHYIPSLQKPQISWRGFLPALSKNSEYRIAHNKNYQYFLKGESADEETLESDEGWGIQDKSKKTYGVDDLQKREALDILKDMILIQHGEKKGKEQ